MVKINMDVSAGNQVNCERMIYTGNQCGAYNLYLLHHENR